MPIYVGGVKIKAIKSGGATIVKVLNATSVLYSVVALVVPTIAITSGSGYADSVYTVTNGGTGIWQADGVNISGATGSTYTMTLANEGKSIRWLRSDVVFSNSIELWVPTDYPNLVAWWDAADSARFDLSVNRVVTWIDKIGGLAASQGTNTNRPTLVAAGRNNKPAVVFNDGNTQFLSFSPSSLPRGDLMVMVLGYCGLATGSGDWRRVFGYGPTVDGNTSLQIIRQGSSKTACEFTLSPSGVDWAQSDRIVVVTKRGTVGNLFVDGPDTAVRVNAFVSTSLSSGGAGYIGRGLQYTDPWPGSVQQIVVASEAGTTFLRRQLEGWASWRNGLAGANLGPYHTYKTAPPFVTDAAPMTMGVMSGNGYAGSVYSVKNGGLGNWQADGVNIDGATTAYYVLSRANEGKAIRWLRSDGVASNAIEMWVPSDLGTALSAWYDANDPSTLTVTSDAVSAFRDKTSNAQHLNQATAGNRPLVAGSEIIFNGGKSLATTNNFSVTGTTPRTMYVVGRRFQTDTSAHALFFGAESTGAAFGIDLNNTTTGIVGYAWGNDIPVGAARDELVLAGLRLDANNVLRASLNGLDATQTYTGGINTGAGTLLMGVRRSADSRVVLREGLVVAAALSALDEARLQGYLAWHNGIQTALVGNHPFRYQPPMVTGTPAITISITSGGGYSGSVYTVVNGGTGNWQADGVNIAGATANTYTLTDAVEGKALRWMRSDGVISNAIEMWLPSDLPGQPDDYNLAPANVALVSTKVSRVNNPGLRGAFVQSTGANQPSYDGATPPTTTGGWLSTAEEPQKINYEGFIFAVASVSGNISAVSTWPSAQGICGFDNGGAYTSGTALFAGGNVMRIGGYWDGPNDAATSTIDVSGGAIFSVYGRSNNVPGRAEISVNGETLRSGVNSERRMIKKTVGKSAEQAGITWAGKIYRVFMGEGTPSNDDIARLQGWARWKLGAGIVPYHPYAQMGPRVR